MSTPFKSRWMVISGSMLGTGLVATTALLTSMPAESGARPRIPPAGFTVFIDGQVLPRERHDRLLTAQKGTARLGDGSLPGPVDAAMKRDLVAKLVDEQLVENAALEFGIEVQEEDIDQALTAFKRRFEREEDFNRLVEGYPLGLPELRQHLRTQWLKERIVELGSVPLADETVRAFFESQPERFLTGSPAGHRRTFEEVKDAVRAECEAFMKHRQLEALVPRLRAKAQISHVMEDAAEASPGTETSWHMVDALHEDVRPAMQFAVPGTSLLNP